MLKIKADGYFHHDMEPYLKKVFEGFRVALEVQGYECSDDQDIIDAIFEGAIKKECAKYGYKG